MSLTNIITDGYERKARLYPALLLIAPLVCSWVSMLTAKFSVLQSIVAGVVACGGAFLLTQLARDAGKRKEALLFVKWGGLPSAGIFRHRDLRIDAITKARFHKKMVGVVKGARAPTPAEEQADPSAADSVYTAWSHYLRVNTRDTKKFSLLSQENASYGYRRNVWGLRPYGIVASVLSIVACGFRLYVIHSSTGKFDEAIGGAAVFAVIMLLLWLFRFSDNWVRLSADAYAERLAECTETIGATTTTPRSTARK